MSYAWKMVALTFFTQFLAMGFTFYSFAVVLKPLAMEFGSGRLGVAMLPVVMSLTGGVLAPFLGRWIARGSIRNIMTLGCVVMGVGFLLVSRATGLWQLGFLFGTLVTFGMGSMAGITTQALVVNWFPRERTMALGMSLMGISLSGVLMAHTTTALVDAGGWRWAFEVFGWVTLCATPIVWLTVISHPDELASESNPDKDSSPDLKTTPAPTTFSTRDALRERNLWIIAVVCGLSFMGTTAVMTHVVAFGTDMGLTAARAAWLLSALAAGAAAGKIIFGWLAGKIGEQGALFVAIAMEGVGMLGFAIPMPFTPLVLTASLLGLGVGGVMPLAAALLARAFGAEAFGPMMGLMTPLMIPFQSVGAPFAAGVFDSTGSYQSAWIAFAAVLVVACGLLSLLRLKTDPEGSEDLKLPGTTGQESSA
jgi:MFS family permease